MRHEQPCGEAKSQFTNYKSEIYGDLRKTRFLFHRENEGVPDQARIPCPHALYTQDELGYLSDAAITHLAKKTELTELEVRNVISYYSLLHTKPMGKFHVQVCTNISCMLRGGEELLEHCKSKLGIGHKQTTADGTFSLEEVECIGGCSWAPAVQVNYDFHENLTNDKMDAVLDSYRKRTKQ
jgi:NADH-quinone oxidoreductase subunit E